MRSFLVSAARNEQQNTLKFLDQENLSQNSKLQDDHFQCPESTPRDALKREHPLNFIKT